MFKELINKYLRKKKYVEERTRVVVPEPVIEEEKVEFDINVSKDENIFMITVSHYITISDFVERMHEIDADDLSEQLGNALLWNGSLQKVNKGTYYVIIHNGYLYNVFLGEDNIGIDERIKVGENTHEKIISLKHDGDYNYTSFKHDKVGSTFYTMYYSKSGFPIPILELTREEAYQEISEVLSNIELVPGIEEVVDVNQFRNAVLDDLVPSGSELKM